MAAGQTPQGRLRRALTVMMLTALMAIFWATAPVSHAQSAQPPSTSIAKCISIVSCTSYYTYSTTYSSPSIQYGFDICKPPTTSQMQDWWTNSPLFWANFYFGGLNWACSMPSYVNTSWIQTVHDQGWYLVPTWVSYQAPCYTGPGALMSSNSTTAYNQGYNEAYSAVQAAKGYSIGPGTAIYDDIEDFSGASSCYTAVAEFLSGWTDELSNQGYTSGVYETNSYSDLQDLCNRAGSISLPYAIWIADWNGSVYTTGISGLNDSCWNSLQRLHQYQGPTWYTYGSTLLQVDFDSAEGPIDR